MSDKSKIFLSYSWKNKDEADEIDNYFQSVGIQFLRDIRDVGYKSSIKEFMQRVGKTDFVVMLISDEFLNSPNCMYEVLELIRDREFSKRMLQVILPGADIYNPKYRIKLIRSWEKRRKEIEKESEGIGIKNLTAITEEIRHYDEICSNIDHFLQQLVDQFSPDFESLKSDGFQPLLDFMKISKNDLLHHLLKLTEIEDEGERLRKIDAFTREHPTFAPGYFALAFHQNDPKNSIYFYTLSINLNPNYAATYSNRGVSKAELGDKKSAIRDFDQAIQIDHDYALAYYNRGNSKSALGNQKGAIEDYDQAIRIDPDNGAAYYNRGNRKSDLGDPQGAIQDYNQAIRIDPNDAKAYYNRGNRKSDLGDPQGAIQDYDQAININPNDATTYFNRGFNKSILGDEEAAIQDYDQAIRIDPNDATAYTNRGSSKSALGNKKGALKDYNRAIRIDPNNAKAYYKRGWTKIALGDEEEGEKDIKIALETSPKFSHKK